MPYFERENARLYFEDVGEGPAIVRMHGLTENHLYWSLPGVVDQLFASGFVPSLELLSYPSVLLALR